MTSQSNNRVLIIDDSHDIHDDFNRILATRAKTTGVLDELEKSLLGDDAPKTSSNTQDGFEVTHAFQGEEGLKLIMQANERGTPFAAVFVDMRMPPGWDGLQTIREIRKVDKDTALVVCTAFSDHALQDIAAEVKELDKLLVLKKPFETVEVLSIAQSLRERWRLVQKTRNHMDELEEVIRNRTTELQVERAKDKIRLEKLEEIVEQRTADLRQAAMFDRLTGLPNRTTFYEQLHEAMRRKREKPDHQFAVMFVDFDRFKVINDSLGHEYGDKLLVAIGQRLSDALRPTDTVARVDSSLAARLGGDEFCILIEAFKDRSHVCKVAERLLKALSVPYKLSGREVNSTASIGLTFSDCGYENAEDIMRDADIAMYRAKMLGKAQFVVFDPSMHAEVFKRMTLEHDLRAAIDRDELYLQFQPITSLLTGETTGVEALVRWRHPERGVVPPSDFIPLAEETGAIHALGELVLRHTCKQLQSWSAQPSTRDRYIAINVSSKQLCDDLFADRFRTIISQNGTDVSRLVVEVTESALAQDPEKADRAIHALQELGVKVYIDDFGTGHSTLSILRHFPVDGLKLDRSFLDKSVASRRSAAVIHSVITLARDLGIKLVCEGVELLEQVALLQTLGCDEAQGFLFSPPTAADSLPASAFVSRAAA